MEEMRSIQEAKKGRKKNRKKTMKRNVGQKRQRGGEEDKMKFQIALPPKEEGMPRPPVKRDAANLVLGRGKTRPLS